MSDFPDLGSEFATAPSSAIDGGDIDFEKAISSFPDISLDGEGDFPTPLIGTGVGGGSFSFGGFGGSSGHEVKVTGDDDFEKFDYQFPEVGVDTPGQVCILSFFPTCIRYRSLSITVHTPSCLWCSTPFRTPPSTIQLFQYTYLESAYRRRGTPSYQVSFVPSRPFSRTHLNPTYHLGTGVLNNKLKSPFVTRNPKMHARVPSRARSVASTSSTKIIVKRRRGVFARISALFFPLTTTVEADGGRA